MMVNCTKATMYSTVLMRESTGSPLRSMIAVSVTAMNRISRISVPT